MKSTSVQSASKKYAIPTKLFDNLQSAVTPPVNVDVDPSKIAHAIGEVYAALATGKSVSHDVYGTKIDNAYVLAQLTAIGQPAPNTVRNVAIVFGGDIKLGV